MPERGPSSDPGALRLAQRIAQRDAELQAQRSGGAAARAGAASREAAGTPASPYARFIPREELGHFAAWQPDSFGDGGRARPNLSAVPDLDQRRRAEARTAAEAQAAAAQAVERERAARAAELVQAREDGYREGRGQAQTEIEQFRQGLAVQAGVQVDALIAALTHRLADLEQDLAQRVAAVALALARQVVRSELMQHPATVVSVAQEALGALLVSARHVTLKLHPDDLALVAEGAGELIVARGARLVRDRSIERGGCIVDSDIGLVDASVATRWQRAAAAMGQDQPWVADAPASAGALVRRGAASALAATCPESVDPPDLERPQAADGIET
jgi:flagellar assembly protein FliH